jgi:hypothetical protein
MGLGVDELTDGNGVARMFFGQLAGEMVSATCAQLRSVHVLRLAVNGQVHKAVAVKLGEHPVVG